MANFSERVFFGLGVGQGGDGLSIVQTRHKLMKVSEALHIEIEAHEKTRAVERKAGAQLEVHTKADVPELGRA